MTDDQIEAEIQAKGKTAPRVTVADVEAAIDAEYFFTGAHGAIGAAMANAHAEHTGVPEHQALSLLTFCVLVLRNGFTVVGTSACVSPENFDAEIGQKVARADAVRQVWPLLGYALRDTLTYRPIFTSAELSETELADLGELAARPGALLELRPKTLVEFFVPPASSHIDRMAEERDQLDERTDKLSAFVKAPAFDALVSEERDDMQRQLSAMREYRRALVDRLDRAHVAAMDTSIQGATS